MRKAISRALLRIYQIWEAYQLAIFSVGAAGVALAILVAFASGVRDLTVAWQAFLYVSLILVFVTSFIAISPVARELRNRAFTRLGITGTSDNLVRVDLPTGPLVAGSDFEITTQVGTMPALATNTPVHFTAVQGRRIIVKHKEAQLASDMKAAVLSFTASETSRCRSGDIQVEVEIDFANGRRQVLR